MHWERPARGARADHHEADRVRQFQEAVVERADECRQDEQHGGDMENRHNLPSSGPDVIQWKYEDYVLISAAGSRLRLREKKPMNYEAKMIESRDRCGILAVFRQEA